MVMANLAMAAYQQRLGEQLGIEPGAEMRMAVNQAERHDLPVILIDREIGVTLNRTARGLNWWQRAALFSGLIGSLISREDVSEEDIEHLKEGDVVETTFAEFAHDRNDLYEPLIAERDRYMAAKLRAAAAEHPGKAILAVVGAGHLKGIAKHLEGTDDPAQTVRALESVPPKSRWPKMIPWLIVALVVFGFYIGFSRNPDLGWQLVRDWVLINGGLSALGALIATAHPLTVVTAFVAAPLTSLNPTIGAGMVTAAAELWLRKPRVGDFSSLRHDTTRLIGWWKNRVSRTLLVFLFSTLGSAIGTYLAGFLIYDRLSS
jgi:pheromone shutdown-related protein TraB